MEIDITYKVQTLVKKTALGFLLFVFCVLLAAFGFRYLQSSMTVSHAKIVAPLVSARVEAQGKILEIFPGDGQSIKAGDVIAKIQVNVTEETLKQMEQTVAYAKQNLEQVQKGQLVTIPEESAPRTASMDSGLLAQAEERRNRMNELFGMGAISASQRDEAESAYQTAKAAANAAGSAGISTRTVHQPSTPEMIKNAQQQLAQAENTLKNAKQQAAQTEIVAPISGTIFLSGKQVGDEVKAGDVIAGIGDLSRLHVEATLTEDEAQRIHLGQLVHTQAGGEEYAGTVQEIHEPDHDGKYAVKISLPAEGMEQLRPGLEVRVEFLRK